jgi:hypothetical protein
MNSCSGLNGASPAAAVWMRIHNEAAPAEGIDLFDGFRADLAVLCVKEIDVRSGRLLNIPVTPVRPKTCGQWKSWFRDSENSDAILRFPSLRIGY